MKLANFIRDNHEGILREWESFARTLLPAAGGLDSRGLRDHADEILSAIVADMEEAQTAAEKAEKSKGQAPDAQEPGGLGSLGQIHAVLRIESGFTLQQVVAEYRALRASVFRLWDDTPDPKGVLRFNEAIDEALAEAIDRFSGKTDQYRDQLIGIVSHDLRNPLGGILTGAAVLLRDERLDAKNAVLASRIQRSAKRMVRIVDDLLDLTRTRLGTGIPIVRGRADVGELCQMVISELERSHPKTAIRYAARGDLHGEWDGDRLAQVISNLVGNALQHGDSTKPIDVFAREEGDGIALSVHNAGPPIPKQVLDVVFEPMVRHARDSKRTSTGLGLGLYIAKELVTAHEGTLDVASSDVGGTTFTVHLPRRAA